MTEQSNIQIHINGHPITIVPTMQLNESIVMSQAVLASPFNRIGVIVGSPGTGKTVAGYAIAHELQGIRICAYPNMTRKDLLLHIARKFNYRGVTSTYNGLIKYLQSNANGQLIILDEGNHLNIAHMETLRYLIDEHGAACIILGTEILDGTLQGGRHNAVLLAQFNSRVGTKRLTFSPIGHNEKPLSNDSIKRIQKYFIEPRFAIEGNKNAVVRAFYKHTHGTWRNSYEFANTCERIMRQQQQESINISIIEAAAHFKGRTI
ncbi:MAG: ATP-binding protein [Candidatus Parabeggiatoa sp.]|nr:ATP-binding protein [Candidatus Parabeggiatoa sp.]